MAGGRPHERQMLLPLSTNIATTIVEMAMKAGHPAGPAAWYASVAEASRIVADQVEMKIKYKQVNGSRRGPRSSKAFSATGSRHAAGRTMKDARARTPADPMVTFR